REVAGHMFTNYDGVLKVDGEVGNKKAYDPRSYLKLAEQGMAHRVVEACEALQSAGTSAARSAVSTTEPGACQLARQQRSGPVLRATHAVRAVDHAARTNSRSATCSGACCLVPRRPT